VCVIVEIVRVVDIMWNDCMVVDITAGLEVLELLCELVHERIKQISNSNQKVGCPPVSTYTADLSKYIAQSIDILCCVL